MKHKEFTQRWVVNLMAGIDAHLDDETKLRLMESCGRACARGGVAAEAEACRGDLGKLLAKLKRWIGKENVRWEGDLVHLTYAKCFCHLVADGPATLPATYCLCSRGWVKEIFETVLEKPVDVELLDSIKRGGESCRFVVHL